MNDGVALHAGTAEAWPPASPPHCLPDIDVHLWSVALDKPPWPVEKLAGILAADERRRADAFLFPADRRRFLTARGVLRMLLGCYIDHDPAGIGFLYGLNGKPELGRPWGASSVQFNCSHCRGFALYAIARGRRVGVDLEALRPLPDAAHIARLCCSPREREVLAAMPPDQRSQALLRAWTMKEAYAKAVGAGLARGLEGVEVTLISGATPAFQSIDGDPEAAAYWSLRALSPAPDHVAALAVEGHEYRLCCWSLVATPEDG